MSEHEKCETTAVVALSAIGDALSDATRTAIQKATSKPVPQHIEKDIDDIHAGLLRLEKDFAAEVTTGAIAVQRTRAIATVWIFAVVVFVVVGAVTTWTSGTFFMLALIGFISVVVGVVGTSVALHTTEDIFR